MTETVLVVAAHPDDEVLGVGGTLAWHAARGDVVHVLIVAEGATSRDAQAVDGLAALRNAAAKAAQTLGARAPIMLGLPDNRLDSLDLLDVIKPVEAVVAELRPTLVYTHHPFDLNIDHQIVHKATLTACRPLPGCSVSAIYTFETVSSTEWAGTGSFQPARFVDISAHMGKKRAALAHYEMEMRAFPHARSTEAIEALAKLRGASVGLGAAEAFGVVRQVNPG